ncbi:MAG: hypothetical protein ABI882_09840 [Acidobacteriota bacterium]
MSITATESRRRDYYASAEIESLVRSFERGEVSREDWDHRSHVTVGCWYLLCAPFAEAVDQMRDALKRHLDAHGIKTTLESGYHETITIGWMRLISQYLAGTNLDCSLVELINRLLQHFGDKNYLLAYYSRERLMSWEARAGWLDPDLKPLP